MKLEGTDGEVSFLNSTKAPSNSAYVRVKAHRRPILAKMLVDSGNLVNDLISEEFAKQLKVKFTPINKAVGTASKGGSVQIIGRSQPIQLFIENLGTFKPSWSKGARCSLWVAWTGQGEKGAK